ncbi:MAG TPA: MBL fold metallo-hydrolase, partial [bacterium]|nr:MBL fold metallo-hydrolase [bacterium]
MRRLRIAAFVALVPMVMALFGCCLDGPAYHGPVSDHFDGKRFHNEVDDMHAAGGLLKWMTHRKHGAWASHAGELPGPPPPASVADSAMRVTFVNHSTVLLQTDGLNVLTDPIWSDRAGPYSWAGEKRKRPPGIRFEDLPKIDVVIISHNHYDHFDLPTLVRLAKRDHPRVFSGLGNAEYLRQHGVDANDLDWWQSVELRGGVTLTSVPAKHFSGRGAFDMARTLWTGYVLQGPSG